MGSFSIGHWVLVLVVVLLIFGTKRLRNMGGDLGTAMRDFKKSLSGDDANSQLKADPPPAGDKVQPETKRQTHE